MPARPRESVRPVRDAIVAVLTSARIRFEIYEHASVRTAEEAARERGTELAAGVKAILMKYDGAFAIFALPAHREIRSRLVRVGLGVRRTRFATADELLAMTGLLPGSVPPFGEPIFALPLFADPLILDRDRIVFTAGARDFSISLTSHDWLDVAKPRLLPISRTSLRST